MLVSLYESLITAQQELYDIFLCQHQHLRSIRLVEHRVQDWY